MSPNSLTLSCLLLFSSLAFGKTDACRSLKSLPKVKDSPFGEARARLIKAGWTPVKQNRPDHQIAVRDVLAAGYEEVEDCAGTGVGACILHYKDSKGNRLKVITWGEPVESMRVHSLACVQVKK